MNPERASGSGPPSARTNGRANPFAAGAGSAEHSGPAAPDAAVGASAASDTHEANRELGRRVVMLDQPAPASTVVRSTSGSGKRRPSLRSSGGPSRAARASAARAPRLDAGLPDWKAPERRQPHVVLLAVLLCLIAVSIVAIGSASDRTADRAPRATVARMVALERANSALTRQRNAALLAERRATRRAARLTDASRRWRELARSHRGRSESAARR